MENLGSDHESINNHPGSNSNQFSKCFYNLAILSFEIFLDYLGGEHRSVSFDVFLFTEGRLRYSNSDVTETVDLVFKLSFERGDTSVTLIGILR